MHSAGRLGRLELVRLCGLAHCTKMVWFLCVFVGKKMHTMALNVCVGTSMHAVSLSHEGVLHNVQCRLKLAIMEVFYFCNSVLCK